MHGSVKCVITGKFSAQVKESKGAPDRLSNLILGNNRLNKTRSLKQEKNKAIVDITLCPRF